MKVGLYTIRSETFVYSQQAEPAELRGTTGTSWQVVDVDGRTVASMGSREAAIEVAERRVRDAQPVPMTLENGRRVFVRRDGRETFRGLDADGNQVYAMQPCKDGEGEYLYAVTRCCQATATGTEDGTACRSCYRPVPSYFGGPAQVAVRSTPTWRSLFPDGRWLFYEGLHPDVFALRVRTEFGFDPSASLLWGVEVAPPGDEPWKSYCFRCPAEHLDDLYDSGRFPLGS